MDNTICHTTASVIATFLHRPLCGTDVELVNYSQLDDMQPNTLVFAKRYQPEVCDLLNARADICAIVPPEFEGRLACPHILSPKPRLDFINAAARFFPSVVSQGFVHPSAVVEEGAQLGENVTVGAFCYVSRQSVVGSHTVLMPRATLYGHTVIGSHCVVKSGAVIGQSGFGFERQDDGTPVQFPHRGGVVIGDHVSIGANTAIDQGTIGVTVIEDFAKIDNLVHIAHNCHVGKGAFVIAGAVLCGGSRVGNRAWIAPQSCIKEHVTVSDDAVVGLGSVVLHDVEASAVVAGNPAKRIK